MENSSSKGFLSCKLYAVLSSMVKSQTVHSPNYFLPSMLEPVSANSVTNDTVIYMQNFKGSLNSPTPIHDFNYSPRSVHLTSVVPLCLIFTLCWTFEIISCFTHCHSIPPHPIYSIYQDKLIFIKHNVGHTTAMVK